MLYRSTRDHSITATSTQAVLDGIASGGGLYMPQNLCADAFDWKSLLNLSTMEMSEKILSHFLPDFEDMHGIVTRAYTGKFATDELTPTVPVGDKYVLELFHGPTAAFKDVALSVLPQLIVAAKKQEGVTDEIMILTATSGDTGKAAMEGFRDVDGTRITVFYPRDGVSTVQKAQMATQEGKNVKVCAVEGNFDDAQTGVKEIFTQVDKEGTLRGSGVQLSSANSINIGRLAPQVVYYFKAYADLVKMGRISVGDEVDFVVPTGNFGNILAGYLAGCLGLPVGKLVCASNANNVLTDFINTGVYDKKRPFYKTASPSMDILVSSNLERLLYLLSGQDCDFVAEKMQELKENGEYAVPETLLRKLQDKFWADCSDDAETSVTIGKVWKEFGYLCDTHTAVGFAVAERFVAQTGSKNPCVVLSTASPYKFPASVVKGLGAEPCEDEFAVMEQLESLTGTKMHRALAGLREKTVLHKDVTKPVDMMDYVMKLVK
ncbi:MAG: threonine synthase [Oscillospiraceae bacterium]|nr:threonine synthase [Oscillospiraceae bacterium]